MLSDRQLDWLDQFKANGQIEARFNTVLFTRSDSTQPELAGVLGAVIGSALMLFVTAALALPIGVGAAVYPGARGGSCAPLPRSRSPALAHPGPSG